VLTVVDHEVVAVAVDVAQGPGRDLVGWKRGGWLVPHPHRSALGELGQARLHHPAAAERIAELMRTGVHDRAVAEIDAVMQVGDGRAGDPMLDLQTVSTRHQARPSS